MRRFLKTLRSYLRRLPLFGGLRRIENQLSSLAHQNLLIGDLLVEHRREMRAVLAGLSLPDPALWRGRPAMVPGAPAVNAFPTSAVCRQASFEEPHFAYWAARLGEGLRYHRKLWEFVFVSQVLWERGALVSRARGLGFGVGLEPLAAFFASQDCEVIGTDMSPAVAEEAGWIATNEHAHGKEALRRPWVCPDVLFDRNVSFRECDMNAIPDDLTGFDFCWSACALEHLGSIQKGLDFVVRSVECLKPGGWAVHTTELNLSSNDDTVDNMDTVLFRRRDLEALAARLTAMGHHVAPFDFDPGVGPLDNYIDVPPYRVEPHLKLALWGYSTTSVGLIIQRGAA